MLNVNKCFVSNCYANDIVYVDVLNLFKEMIHLGLTVSKTYTKKKITWWSLALFGQIQIWILKRCKSHMWFLCKLKALIN